jgi:TrmH family RNA methyltransferase
MHEVAVHSRHNPHIQKWLRWLKQPASQKRDGVILLEGAHGVMLGLAHGFRCRLLLIDDSINRQDLAEYSPRIAQTLLCPTPLISAISSLLHVDQRMMLAVFDYPESPLFPTATDDVLILDGVQDPGNVGTIMRSAAALGVRWVLSMQGSVGLWHPKVVRAAQGVHFHLHLREGIPHDQLSHWQQHHFALRPFLLAEANGTSAAAVNLTLPQTWVLGNEGQGINPAFAALPHQRIAVPMPGGVESLNVAVASAILLYEQCRQRQIHA